MFKETFNTDKSRLDKRQTKLNLPQDFAIIMLDNVHKVDSDGKSKSKTAGKSMVYAKGTCKDKFLGDGIKYSKDQFYVHKNNYDFEEEVIKVNRRLQNNDNNVSIQDGEDDVPEEVETNEAVPDDDVNGDGDDSGEEIGPSTSQNIQHSLPAAMRKSKMKNIKRMGVTKITTEAYSSDDDI